MVLCARIQATDEAFPHTKRRLGIDCLAPQPNEKLWRSFGRIGVAPDGLNPEATADGFGGMRIEHDSECVTSIQSSSKAKMIFPIPMMEDYTP
jgi:hypothetical protein